mmetsp:Transcript_10192/g.30616  ORF Transcript_10192/g.30616 Transcript_10192/m.30616 type:complete len:563 (+) Transcript_10192:34-1722(+)
MVGAAAGEASPTCWARCQDDGFHREANRALERFRVALEAQGTEIERLWGQHDGLSAELAALKTRVAAMSSGDVVAAKPGGSTGALAMGLLACSSSSPAEAGFSQRSLLPSVASAAPEADAAAECDERGAAARESLPPDSEPLSRRLATVMPSLARQVPAGGSTSSIPARGAGRLAARGQAAALPSVASVLPAACSSWRPCVAEAPQRLAAGPLLEQALRAWDVVALLVRAAGLPAAFCLALVSTAFGRSLDDVSFAFPLWFPRRIYVLGGAPGPLESVTSALRAAECFDPRSGSWQVLAPMLEARRQPAAVAFGGFVYAIGGHDGVRALASVERYSSAEGVWEAAPPLLSARSAATAAVVGRLLYVAGGHDGLRALVAVERLALGGVRWEAAPTLRRARLQAAALVQERQLFMVGGHDGAGHALRSTELLAEPSAEAWREEPLPLQLTPRLAAAVVGSVSGMLVSAGGRGEGDACCRALASVEGLTAGEGGRCIWTPLPALRTRRLGATATKADGCIYVVGGCCDGAVLASVERWSVGSAAWVPLPPMVVARDGAASTSARF